MDFTNVDMKQILHEAIPKRFADMDPKDFEHFIAQLFRDKGYVAEVTGYVGDYGNDVTLTDSKGVTTAVQVKRYKSENKVSVPDVNQVLGGMQRYNCDKAMVVTTSDFTKPARSMEEQGLVEFIAWDDLEPMLCETYLDGKSHYEFFKEYFKKKNDGTEWANDVVSKGPIFYTFSQVSYNMGMEKTSKVYTLVHFDLENLTSSNLNFDLKGGVTCITSDKRQIESKSYLTGHMPDGKFYAGVKQSLGVWFESSLLTKVDDGTIFIFEYLSNGETYEFELKLSENRNSSGEQLYIQNNSCFIATAAYGTPFAEEIDVLRNWRDDFLAKSYLGEKFIKMYYSLSPAVANNINTSKIKKKTVRITLDPIVKILKDNYSK